MREVAIKLYKFEELEKSAQDAAVNAWMESEAHSGGYPWEYENRKSIEAFDGYFGCRTNWSYDVCSGHASVRVSDSVEELEITGVRLRTYILNNFYSLLYKQVKYALSAKNPRRWASKIQKQETDCPFTGYCEDEAALAPIRAFIKKPCNHTTLADLLQECADSWVKACSDDMTYYYSEENARESIIANGYEFTEDGNFW